MEFKDYYKILGVDTDADGKAIKTAYRKLARQYHPDVSSEHDAEAKFKEVTEAYEVLKSSEKRAEYDEMRRYGQQGQFTPPPGWQSSTGFKDGGSNYYEGDFSEFFSSIFGGAESSGFTRQGRHSNQRGRDIEVDLPVFLEDTLRSDEKTIEYNLPHINARGQQENVRKTLKVKIPAGVSEGERIRLKGQGSPGTGEAASGDLYLRIKLVPHPLFDIEAHNLLITVPISPWEAALGTKITLPTLEGEIRMSIPENSQTGQRLRIKGRGMVHKQGRGDLYAVLKIVMPDKVDDAAKQHWKELAEKVDFNPRQQWSK